MEEERAPPAAGGEWQHGDAQAVLLHSLRLLHQGTAQGLSQPSACGYRRVRTQLTGLAAGSAG